VVIAIITVLAGLIMAGVTAVRERQQKRTTEDIVIKLQVGLDNQVKLIADQARKDRQAGTGQFRALVAYCDGDEDRAEALLMYCKLRQAFPQSWAEHTTTMTAAPLVGQPGFTVGGVNFPRHPAYASLPNVSTWPAEHQSAALLYLALTGMAAGGNAFASDDATTSAQIDLPIASGGHARVYKDVWGTPIAFQRFFENPAVLNIPPYVNPNDAAAGRSVDPFDTQSKLWRWTPTPAAKKTAAQTAVGATFNGNNKVISVYSAGVDKVYDNLGNDDVLGYHLRKLGEKSQ
jgi:hypothetical protein